MAKRPALVGYQYMKCDTHGIMNSQVVGVAMMPGDEFSNSEDREDFSYCPYCFYEDMEKRYPVRLSDGIDLEGIGLEF